MEKSNLVYIHYLLLVSIQQIQNYQYDLLNQHINNVSMKLFEHIWKKLIKFQEVWVEF